MEFVEKERHISLPAFYIKPYLEHGRPRSTMDSILASHQSAPGSNLGQDIFSLLLSLWTVLRSNPSSAKGKGFRKSSAAKA